MLDKNYNENKSYTEKETEEVESKWLDISDEYFALKNDGKGKMYLETRSQELYLSAKIRLYTECIKTFDSIIQISMFYEKEAIDIIANEMYDKMNEIHHSKVSKDKSIVENISIAADVLKSLERKYKFKFKQKEKAIQDEVTNSFKIVASVEDILKRSLGDISKMSVAQWLAYEESASEKVKQLKKNNRGR